MFNTRLKPEIIVRTIQGNFSQSSYDATVAKKIVSLSMTQIETLNVLHYHC